MLELSIVIPVFNCLALTQACLKSLEETIGGRADFEVIVVDNASTDGTAEWLATLRGPRYRVLRHERNLGYAAANNSAARLATGRLLLLLNNDTVLLPGWVEPMQRVLARAEKAGLVGNIQREAESGLINHAGILFTAEGVPQHYGKGAVAPPRQEYRRFPAVTAACCLLRRDVFLRMGGFSEEFQNGYEDVDFCLRLRREELYCYVANRSVIYHHVSATAGRHQRDAANFARLSEIWAPLIQQRAAESRDAEVRQRDWPSRAEAAERSRREQRRDGWRYVKKYCWRPWCYDANRLRQAVSGILARPSGPPAASEPFFFE